MIRASWPDPDNNLPNRGYIFPEASAQKKERNLQPRPDATCWEWGVWAVHDTEENHFQTLRFSAKSANILSVLCIRNRWPVSFVDNAGLQRFKNSAELYEYVGRRMRHASELKDSATRAKYLSDLTVNKALAPFASLEKDIS